VRFPSWGGAAARVDAVLRGGGRVALGGAPLALARVAHLEVRSERSGYTVVPLAGPPGATVRLLHSNSQPSNPNPGPTLAVRLATPRAFRHLALTVRIVV
jgi:hypothetical protein